jgi:2'-5' RNA ligase
MIEQVVSQLRQTAKESHPLVLKITKYSSFSPVNNVRTKLYSGSPDNAPE